MQLKDYYGILEVEPGATELEIKRGFRKLAHYFHPDKHDGSAEMDDWYGQIQEAYKVLTNPAKKEAYLEERWLAKTRNSPLIKPGFQSPGRLAIRSAEMLSQIRELDHYRMSHERLQLEMTEFLTPQAIHILGQKDAAAEREMVFNNVMQMLPFLKTGLHGPVIGQLEVLSQNDPLLQAVLKQFLAKSRFKQKWGWLRSWGIVLLTLLIMVVMFLLSRNPG